MNHGKRCIIWMAVLIFTVLLPAISENKKKSMQLRIAVADHRINKTDELACATVNMPSLISLPETNFLIAQDQRNGVKRLMGTSINIDGSHGDYYDLQGDNLNYHVNGYAAGRVGDQYAFVALNEADDVQILAGGASAEYGSNAASGVCNMVVKSGGNDRIRSNINFTPPNPGYVDPDFFYTSYQGTDGHFYAGIGNLDLSQNDPFVQITDDPNSVSFYGIQFQGFLNGDLLCVWESSAQEGQIKSQVLTKNENGLEKLSGNFTIDIGEPASNPQLAIYQNYPFIVFEGENSTMKILRLDPVDYSKPDIGPISVHSDATSFYRGNPDISIFSQDLIGMSWVDMRPDQAGPGVYYQGFSLDLEKIGEEAQVYLPPQGVSCSSPDLQYDEKGVPNIFYQGYDAERDFSFFYHGYQLEGGDWNAFQLNTYPGAGADAFDLVGSLGENGDIATAWVENIDGNSQTYYQTYTTERGPSVEYQRLNDNANSSQQKIPDLAVGPDDKFGAVWYSESESWGSIEGNFFDDDGSSLTGEFSLSDPLPDAFVDSPQIAVDDLGNYAVTYNQTTNHIDNDVMMLFLDADGNPLYGPAAADPTPDDQFVNPHFESVKNNETSESQFILSYSQINDDGSSNVQVQFYNPDGSLVGDVIDLPSTMTWGDNQVSIADLMENDNLFVLFSQQQQDQSYTNVMVQEIDLENFQVAVSYQFITYDPPQSYGAGSGPRLDYTVTYGGQIAITSDFLKDENGKTKDIQVTLLDENLNLILPPFRPYQSDQFFKHAWPSINVVGEGRLLSTWREHRLDSHEVYGNIINYSMGLELGVPFQIAGQGAGMQKCASVEDVPVPGRQMHPRSVVHDDHIYSIWTDNRVPGRGYDIWMNIIPGPADSSDTPDTSQTTVPRLPDGPNSIELFANYPNPFNPHTTINYTLSDPTKVILTIFDMTGREVEEVLNERQGYGSHQVVFDAGHLPTGLYVYELKAGKHVERRKMMLVK